QPVADDREAGERRGGEQLPHHEVGDRVLDLVAAHEERPARPIARIPAAAERREPHSRQPTPRPTRATPGRPARWTRRGPNSYDRGERGVAHGGGGMATPAAIIRAARGGTAVPREVEERFDTPEA